MKKLCYLMVFLPLVLLGGAGISSPAQGTKTNADFAIDVNLPFVYVKFDQHWPESQTKRERA